MQQAKQQERQEQQEQGQQQQEQGQQQQQRHQHQQVQLQEQQQQQQQGQEQQEQHLQEEARVEALLASRLAAQQLGFNKVMRKIYIIQSKLPGCSVLEAAAWMGELQLLGELLQTYPENGMSQAGLRKDVHAAALRAATTGHAECLRLLLDWDPSSTPELLEARDPEGWTMLIICAARGNVDCMRLLLAHSPDTQVAAVTPTGDSALMTACKQQHPDAVELLLQYSPLTQVAAVAADGMNALMAAVRNGSTTGVGGDAGAPDVIVRQLLRHNPAAQVAAGSANGETALIVAVHIGHAACLPDLLAHSPQAQVGVRFSGWTPLMLAANKGDCASMRHLLAHSPDTQVAAADAQGWTALMKAAARGHRACLQLLLEHSPEAQLAAVLGAGESAVILAACWGHVDCLQLLLGHNPPRQQLNKALLETGRKLYQQQQQEAAAPAGEQLRRGWTTCIERLLAAGAWTPAEALEEVVDIVIGINKGLVSRALVPDMANAAVVGLAGAVRQQRPAGEDVAGPSKLARPSP